MADANHIGFTGSRLGMTLEQRIIFTKILARCRSKTKENWLHHGLCVGSDKEAHETGILLGFKIHGHPPLDETYMVSVPCNKLDSPFSFSGRNQRIAVATRIMIATPRTGSVGTYNAIAHAERLKKPRIIIHAAGVVDYYDCKAEDFV